MNAPTIIRANDGFAILQGTTFATVGGVQWFTSAENLLVAWQCEPNGLDLRTTFRALYPDDVCEGPTHTADFLRSQFLIDLDYNTSPLERALNADGVGEVVDEALRSWRQLGPSPSGSLLSMTSEQVAAWTDNVRAQHQHGALLMLLTMSDAERHQLRVDLGGTPLSPAERLAADVLVARKLIVLKPEYGYRDWRLPRSAPNFWKAEPFEGDQIGAIRDFIAQLKGGPRTPYMNIATMAFATKRYGEWPRQRCDTEFGYGPRHGTINMSVELRREWRPQVDDLPLELVTATVRVLEAMLDGRLPTDALKEAP